MPFDGFVARCLYSELSRILPGSRISKISQPSNYDIYLDLSKDKVQYRLLLSADPSMPRIYLTNEKRENPAVAPGFCMLLRKHFRNGVITSVRTIPYERIIFFDISAGSELGDTINRTLVAEIMGKYSNIILLDENRKILDAIRHVDSDISRVRQILPAMTYELPPPQEKALIDDIEPGTFFLKTGSSDQSLSDHVISRIKGTCKRTVLELLSGTGLSPGAKTSAISSAETAALVYNLTRIKNMVKSNIFTPCIIYQDPEKLHPADVYCLSSEDGHRKYDKSMSRMLDLFFSEKSKSAYLISKYQSIEKTVQNLLLRLDKKEKIHNENIKAASDSRFFTLCGELITANLYRLRQAESLESVTLENYYSDPPENITIPLDPSLSTSKNAAAYFAKASKIKAAAEHSGTELIKLSEEKTYLNSVLFSLSTVSSPADIEEIRTELTRQKYIPPANGLKKKSKAAKPLPPLAYITSEGFQVFAGRNNLQNEALTLRAAASRDLWFHTKNYPGSHVILRQEAREITRRAIEEAAQIAAFHSKASSLEKAEVDYTLIKNVKRHSNKKPGMVYYTDYKTVLVSPEKPGVRHQADRSENDQQDSK